MRYPSINRVASRQVTIPKFLGTNLADPLNLVADNQLTDSLNVWEQDGFIQTRPGLTKKSYIHVGNDNRYVFVPDFSFYYNDKKCRVIVSEGQFANEMCLNFTAISSDGSIQWRARAKCPVSEGGYLAVDKKFVIFEGRSMHTGGQGIFLLINSSLYELTKHNEAFEFEALLDSEIYSPTIMMNGKGTLYGTLPVSEEAEYAPASSLEGYNMIDNAWQSFKFTTDGVSSEFELPVADEILDFRVEHTITSDSGTVSVDVYSIPGGASVTRHCETDTSKTCSKFGNKFCFSSALKSSLGVITNNLVIKIKIKVDSKLKNITMAEWYGGESKGINGGTRLFVAGEDSVLCYSDTENHTYFPIYNYMYVGAGKITALKKQSNMLVIFKEREIWYTTSNTITDYTSEDVINSSYDVATGSVLLPLIMLHGEIGCTQPGTIQLCGNRLVWLTRNGNSARAYMLKSADQYSVANVVPISAMIERKFMGFYSPSSAVYKGYYLLLSQNRLFALNCDTYYFSTAPQYADTEASQRKQQWYIWELPPYNDIQLVSDGDSCAAICLYASDGNARVFVFNGVADEVYDNGQVVRQSIKSMLQTKAFDFGAIDRFKKIEQIYIELGDVLGNTNINYITEKGELFGEATRLEGTLNEEELNYFKTYRFVPGIKRALRFGIRVESSGVISVGGITIKYKPMGVKR